MTNISVKCETVTQPRVRMKLIRWWLRSHWILAAVDRLFYPLVLYAVYLLAGKWKD